MGIQRTKFHASIGKPPPQVTRQEIVEPILGLNSNHQATELRPGETPFSQNFALYYKLLQPRSGLSSFGTTPSGISTPLGYFSVANSNRSEVGYIMSQNSMQVFQPNLTRWVPQQAASGFTFSATTGAYYTFAQGIRPDASAGTDPRAVYMTNWVLPPRIVSIATVAPISPILDLTEVFSLLSNARYVTAFDDRILFFHTSNGSSLAAGTNTLKPTRIVGSARGNNSDFTNGFFEDITMQGVGTGMVPERDRLILLSSAEVWQARPRRDVYAFDFFNMDRVKGCPIEYDRTPQSTDIGTIWLGAGFQFYRTVGDNVHALGDKVREFLKNDMREWGQAFSFFNPTEHIYGLVYSNTTGSYPNRALFLRTDTVAGSIYGTREDGTWFMQDFGDYQFTAAGLYGTNTVLISSAGSPFRLLSTQTTDNGVAIDCRWRSHAIRGQKDIFPYEAITELWTEYESSSLTTGGLAIYTSPDEGGTFAAISIASTISGINYTMTPVMEPANRNPMFEVRINDGTKPSIARFQITLRSYTGRYSGSA